jgi:lipoprotein-anchoring transpeptidase ErfK/SrfK
VAGLVSARRDDRAPPDIKPQLEQLQSGMGVPGGPRNPIGARGHYLWQDGKDTLYRIHGTTEPWTIGTNVSSGASHDQSGCNRSL